MGVEAVSFYLVAYFITTIGAFGILATLSDEDRDAEEMEDYQGLLWRRPWTAAILSAMLLSLAGIPLTAGFIGKFYLVAAGVNKQQWLLVFMLALNSAIGLYYYIRIIAVMFERHEGEEEPVGQLHPSVYIVSGVTMGVLVTLLLWVGIYPEWMMDVIKDYVNR
jgi:NADH-quinone oxidoreductase subunit N